ncbi:ribosome biogenesis GTPase Der [Patescibacteria group bacterium]|nr:ribosome biogenesis GTPase Der [Patescibacteria group bacterium]MBU1721433.1 ribosome biogenesis GTPase Der [Patescibacteria group bacterium]MBU1901574.1 ribosome biogenesis GTPase Der [Patescibacteria group bacterium]
MTKTQKYISKRNLPTLALIGRVNVGKSTLFNTLTKGNKALISDIPGTTRTSNEGIIVWRGQEIALIDTGGLTFDDEKVPLADDIIIQSERAIKEADIILFVVDARAGVLPQEKELAKRLRKMTHKPVLLIANKVDNPRVEMTLTDKEWYQLGLGEPFAVAGASGKQTGDLLDHVFTMLETLDHNPEDADREDHYNETITVSLIGKPNVGKSSLFNKIIGQEKVIVSPMAHTTREPHDTLVTYEQTTTTGETIKQQIKFIDTAGIRRKSKVHGILERMGIHKSIHAADDSEITLLVLDGSETISSQDMQLGGLLEKRSKSVIILINKWDLTEENDDTHRNHVQRMVHSYFPHLKFAPIFFVSGKTGEKVHQIFPAILHAWHARQTHIANRALEKFLENATKEHRPARGKGTRHPKLLGMHQVNENPPIFELFIKQQTSLHRSYVHYLENRLREQFDFFATPIVIKLKKVHR